MNVLFISSNTALINMRTLPLGLAGVATAAKRSGHRVAMLDLAGEDHGEAPVARAIAGSSPDVIGISVRNIDDQNAGNPVFLLDRAREVVAACRSNSSAPIVLGGAGYSIYPGSALEFLGADMGIQGDGEVAFCRLLSALEGNTNLEDVPGLFIRGKGNKTPRMLEPNLDRHALPDIDLMMSLAGSDRDLPVPVQARRGCAMRCSYCSTHIIEGTDTRKRSCERLVDWISEAGARGFEKFYFVDNNFNIPASFALELCKQIFDANLDIDWRCILNPLHVDEALATVMARAGCTEVSLGFESGCERILKAMNKKFSVNDVRRAASHLADQGIRRMGFLLLGGPEETIESAEQSLAFADSLSLEMVKVTSGIRIYPDTALARIAIEQGIVKPDDDLLHPRFYIVPGLKEPLNELLSKWRVRRPSWIIA